MKATRHRCAGVWTTWIRTCAERMLNHFRMKRIYHPFTTIHHLAELSKGKKRVLLPKNRKNIIVNRNAFRFMLKICFENFVFIFCFDSCAVTSSQDASAL